MSVVVTERDLTLLREARALLAQGWTKDAFARDAKQQKVAPDSNEAVQWCAFGAMMRCGGPVRSSLFESAMEEEGILVTGLGDFNDHPDTTHDDLLRLFDLTIERVEMALAKEAP